MISVLYVDDEPGLLEIAQLFLEQMGGFSVRTVLSAEEALAVPSISSFDAIISDYHMPGMDGIEFLKAVRQRFGDIPFILFTGRGREEVVVNAINFGADFYIQKGGDPKSQFAELSHKIRQAVRRKKAEAELAGNRDDLNQIFSSVQSGIVIIDATTHEILDLNPAAVRMIGKQKEEILHTICHRFICPAEQGKCPITDLHQTVDNSERTLLTADGRLIPIIKYVVPFKFRGRDCLLETFIDNTERKRAEVALLERERQYRTLIETANEGIWTIDAEFLTTFVNRKMQEIFGYSEQEMLGRPVWDFVPGNDVDSMKKDLLLRKTGVPGRYERQWVRKDGTLVWCLTSATPLFSHDGAFIGSFGMFTDITDSKRAEEMTRAQFNDLKESQRRLTESEVKYRSILENIQDAYYRSDIDGNLIMMSPSGVRLLGYEKEEDLLGVSIARKIYANPDDRAGFLEAIKKTGSVQDYEVNLKRRDGTIVTVSTNSHFYIGSDGKIAGIEGIFRDITEKKKAEDDLKKSENFYRTVFDNTGAATIIIAPDTTILRANDGWVKMTGVPREEQENKLSWTTFFEEEDVKRMVEYHYARRKDPSSAPTVYESTLVDKNGKKHPCFVHVDVIPGTKISVASLVDITEEKAAGQELLESERKVRTLLESVPDLIIVHRDGRILYANPVVLTMAQATPDMVMNRPLLDFVAPEYHAVVADAINHRLLTGSQGPYEIELLTPDKGRMTVLVRGTIIEFDGAPAVLNVLTDITYQKKAERALRESEMKYRTVVEQSTDGIFIAQDGWVVFSNPAISAMTGQPGQDLIGRSIADLIAPEDRDLVMTRHRDRLAGKDLPDAYEFSLLHADGIRRIRVLMNVSPITFGGRPATLGTLHNVTEDRKREEALRESEEKFRSFVENADDIVFSLTPDGIFSYVSPNWTEQLGHEISDVTGKPAEAFIHPEDYPRNREMFLLAITTGKKIGTIEYRVRHKNGTWRWHSNSISAVHGPDGNIISLQGIAHDITERKLAEEALSRANRQLNLLSGITRHDIVNKISVIVGYLRIAEMKFHDPALDELLKKIDSNVAAIREQIEFARVYQELGTMELRWINLNTALPLSEVPEAISLHYDVQGVSLYADPMLEKVFFNLLDNTIRHGERVTEIRVSTQREGNNLVIVWEDNGVGVAAYEKEKIFERGFGKHTGLGLFLVREILSLTGITIAETGEPGKGARFEIRAPEGIWRINGECT